MWKVNLYKFFKFFSIQVYNFFCTKYNKFSYAATVKTILWGLVLYNVKTYLLISKLTYTKLISLFVIKKICFPHAIILSRKSFKWGFGCRYRPRNNKILNAMKGSRFSIKVQQIFWWEWFLVIDMKVILQPFM